MNSTDGGYFSLTPALKLMPLSLSKTVMSGKTAIHCDKQVKG